VSTPRRVRRATAGGGVTLAAVLVLLVAGGLATGDGGRDRRDAVALAAAVCGGGALSGRLLGRRAFRSPAAGVSLGLGAVALRILPALAALAWIQAAAPRLRAAGGGEMMVVFYLALLAADLFSTIIGGRRDARDSASN